MGHFLPSWIRIHWPDWIRIRRLLRWAMALWTNLEPVANDAEYFLQLECSSSLYATALWTFYDIGNCLMMPVAMLRPVWIHWRSFQLFFNFDKIRICNSELANLNPFQEPVLWSQKIFFQLRLRLQVAPNPNCGSGSSSGSCSGPISGPCSGYFL